MLRPGSSISKSISKITYISQRQEQQKEPRKASEEQKYRLMMKNLSFRHLKSYLDLTDFNIKDHEIRQNMFKYGFIKKIHKMAFNPWRFPYHAHRIPKKLTQLVLKQHRSCGCHQPEAVYLELKKKLTVKVFESLKHLKQLKIMGYNIHLKEFRSIKKFANLEHFSFQIYEHDIPSFSNLFQRLTRLQTVELTIRKGIATPLFASKQRNMTWMFLRDLIRLKKLKALKLNIFRCAITRNPHFFYRLLEMLSENTKLEILGLTLNLTNFKEEEHNERANKVLSQFQSLDIRFGEYDFYFSPSVSGQKTLCLNFLPSSQNNVMNLSKIITKCNELKSLALKGDDAKLAVSPKLHLNSKLRVLQVNISKYCDQKTLEFLEYLSNSSANSQITNFNMELSHFTDDILKELTKINSLLTTSEIQEYSLKSHDPFKIEQAKLLTIPPRSDIYCLFIESLCQLTSLQNLRLNVLIEETDPLEVLEKSLSNLMNLVSLELEIYANQTSSKTILFIDLPFSNLFNLQSITLKLSNRFRFKHFLGFFDKLAQLQEIRDVYISCIQIDPKDKKSLDEMNKTLDKLPKFKGFEKNRHICGRWIDIEAESNKQ